MSLLPIQPSPHIDHTLLKLDAVEKDIIRLMKDDRLCNFRSLCIYPKYIPIIYTKRLYWDCYPRISTVVGFPNGFDHVVELPNEIIYADEVDMVWNVDAYLQGDLKRVEEEIRMVRDFIGKYKYLKVIVETTKLTEEQLIDAVIFLNSMPIECIKTNTGLFKERKRLLEEDVRIIKKYIKNRAIKAAGGIKTFDEFLRLKYFGADIIGTSNGVSIQREYINRIGNPWKKAFYKKEKEIYEKE